MNQDKLIGTYRAIKTGKNNITVTIPRRYVIDHGIESGDDIDIYSQDGLLIMIPAKERK